jgi:hypothetical protein
MNESDFWSADTCCIYWEADKIWILGGSITETRFERFTFGLTTELGLRTLFVELARFSI